MDRSLNLYFHSYFYRHLIDCLSWINESGKRENTPFGDIFKGQLRQEITCKKCGYVSITKSEFKDILLDIKFSSTIEDAFNNFFSPKPVGDLEDPNTLFTCEKCQIKVEAQCQLFISQAPPVLCLHLKRFTQLSNSWIKDTKYVQLCQNLNVTPYQYMLRSMITHIGNSPTGGHYTSIGQISSKQFCVFDDEKVNNINTDAVLKTASYVIYYEMDPKSWLLRTKTKLDNNVGTKPSDGK